MTELNAALLAPITDAQPAGPYLQYEKVYLDLEEARREDDGMPQGDWARTPKVADWSLVARLATTALTKQTKDLQIAAWLTEAWLRQDGIAGLRRGLALILELLQRYWESVHPRIDEDGDTGMRARPLGWMGLTLDVPVRLAPLNQDGHSLIDLRVSKSVPTREEAERNSDKAKLREAAEKEGRPTPEDVEQAYKRTDKEWLRALVADIDGSLELLASLDELCTSRFAEDPPSFSDLRNVLEEVRQVAGQLLARKLVDVPDPPEQIEAEPVASLDAATGAAEPKAGATAAAVTIAAGPRDRDEAALWIAAAARKLRQEQPTDPAPYLMLRGFRWGELRSRGGRIDPRMLAAPPTDVRTRLKSMLLEASWPQLLNTAEEVMAQAYGRGWLDLQRYVLTASDGLGSEYEAVGAAIRGALRSLLADLPELVTQTLMDDSPTANAETRAWLRDEHLLASDEELDLPQEPRPATMRRDPYEVAQARVRAGDPVSAMELLMRASAMENSARARFLRRIQAAEVMVGAGMEPVAMPILRELMALIETHRLEDWESGDTVSQPLALLYRCAKRLDSNDVDARSLYDRISRLDPIRAVQLQTARSDHEGS